MLLGHSGWAVQMAAASRSCVSEQKAGSQQQPCGEVRHSGKYPEVLKFSALPAAAFALSLATPSQKKENFSWIWMILIKNLRQKQQLWAAVITVEPWTLQKWKIMVGCHVFSNAAITAWLQFPSLPWKLQRSFKVTMIWAEENTRLRKSLTSWRQTTAPLYLDLMELIQNVIKEQVWTGLEFCHFRSKVTWFPVGLFFWRHESHMPGHRSQIS